MGLQCQAGQGAPQTEVAPWDVTFLCLLKDISAMNLCNLYLIACVFLASVPPCLDYELFNFIKYCMEEELFYFQTLTISVVRNGQYGRIINSVHTFSD